MRKPTKERRVWTAMRPTPRFVTLPSPAPWVWMASGPAAGQWACGECLALSASAEAPHPLAFDWYLT